MKLEIKEKFYNNGNISAKYYYLNGNLHREDGPAITWYYENGKLSYEAYYINNKYHREDGPAIIDYFKSGNIVYESYYLNNKSLTKSKFLLYQRSRKLKTLK